MALFKRRPPGQEYQLDPEVAELREKQKELHSRTSKAFRTIERKGRQDEIRESTWDGKERRFRERRHKRPI